MLPLVAVTLVGLMALIALSIDGGVLQTQRRLAQNAADAAALAGAAEILRAQTDEVIFASALAQAARNGFTNGANGIVVTAVHPTSPDRFTGASYVKVVVTDTVRSIFAGIIGRPKVVIRARSFGGIINPSGACMVSLDPTASQALRVDGGADVNAANCQVKVNSTASDAMCFKDAGTTFNATGGSIDIAGSYTGCAMTPTPTPSTGVAPTADPLGYLTLGAFSHTCDRTNYSLNSGSETLSPGTYCGGIEVKSGADVSLSQGTYYLLGGGLNIQNNGTTLTSLGTGVTIVNTWDATHAYSRINIQSGTVVNLSANTDAASPFPGVLFYQDPTVTGNAGLLAGNANNFQSGAGSTLVGSLYFPTQDVELHSGSTTDINGGIIARRIWIHNNTVVNLTGGGGGTGYYSVKRPAIVE
jgi:hypothetical protein